MLIKTQDVFADVKLKEKEIAKIELELGSYNDNVLKFIETQQFKFGTDED